MDHSTTVSMCWLQMYSEIFAGLYLPIQTIWIRNYRRGYRRLNNLQYHWFWRLSLWSNDDAMANAKYTTPFMKWIHILWRCSMSSEEQRLESKILYFEDMMFRCKGYEYQKVETIRKEISDMRIQLQRIRFKNMRKSR